MKSDRQDNLHILYKYLLGEDYNPNKGQQISISDFYAYVFANKAEIKAIDFVAPKKSSNKKSGSATGKILDSSRKILNNEEIQKKKHAEKQKQLNNFRDALSEDVINNSHFRIMLRQVKSKALEIFLFGNTTDSLPEPSENYNFSSDDDIKAKFIALNNTYQFYDKDKLLKASEQFVSLYKGCKLIADFIEKNNDEDNSVAALHAYKILVLFNKVNSPGLYPFAHIEHFLQQYDGYKQPHPIHDILVTNLPNNTQHKIHDLDGWQRLIQNHGIKAIQCFQRADVIDNELGKTPENLKQAEEILAKSSYKRYEEYPELAELCIQYKVSEDNYNKCLEIRKNIKKDDNLPDYSFDVDGSTLSPDYTGYHLAKLPIDDPRAYILGHITSCCQSIGGDSEQCVIDGITLENNGFYVLLKNKAGAVNPHRLPDGRINYKDFDIIGQGYTWVGKTDNHNLTFDSWENLHPSNDISSCALLKLPGELKATNIFEDTSLSSDNIFALDTLKHIIVRFKEKLYYANLKTGHLSIVSSQEQYTNPLHIVFNKASDNTLLVANKDTISHINKIINNSQDDEITVSLLRHFGKTYTDASESLRVTIGKGGKTPSAFKIAEQLTYPEKMSEGKQYRDSKSQSIVYLNAEKYQNRVAEIDSYINELTRDNTDLMHLFKSDMDALIFNQNNLKALTTLIEDKNTREIIEYIYSEHNPHKKGTMQYDLYESNTKLYEEYLKQPQIWTTLLLLYNNNDLNMESYKTLEEYLKYQCNNYYNNQNSKLLTMHDDFNKTLEIIMGAGLYHHDIFEALLIHLDTSSSYLILVKNLTQRQLLSTDSINRIISLRSAVSIFSYMKSSDKNIETLFNKNNELIFMMHKALHILKFNCEIQLDEKTIDLLLSFNKPEEYKFIEQFNEYLNNENFISLLSKFSSATANHDNIISALQFLDKNGILLKNTNIFPTVMSNIVDEDFVKSFIIAIDKLPKLPHSSMYQTVIECILLQPQNISIIMNSLIELTESLMKNCKEIPKSHQFGLYATEKSPISSATAIKLLRYMCGTENPLSDDEVNQITTNYGEICKTLIENNYPMPQELKDAISMPYKFEK